MATRSETLTQPSVAVAKKAPMSIQRQQQIWGWIFLSPWIIGFTVFWAFPIVISLIFTFTNFNLTRPDEIQFIGLANWRKMFTDPVAIKSLEVTFRFALWAVPLAIAIPLGLATLLNNKDLMGKRFFRTLFYMPFMVPVVSSVFIFGSFLNPTSGWMNRMLSIIGVQGPNWLLDPTWIYPALFLVGIWGAGNAMLTMLATMQGVPTELYDAAKVDGAGPFRTWRNITLPMISPVIFYNLVLTVIGLMQYFTQPYILTEGTGRPDRMAFFFNMHLYRTAFAFQDMGYGATLAWLIFIFALVATLVLFATARHWVYYAGER
jgi:multiple sugar transport system permease protein